MIPSTGHDAYLTADTATRLHGRYTATGPLHGYTAATRPLHGYTAAIIILLRSFAFNWFTFSSPPFPLSQALTYTVLYYTVGEMKYAPIKL